MLKFKIGYIFAILFSESNLRVYWHGDMLKRNDWVQFKIKCVKHVATNKSITNSLAQSKSSNKKSMEIFM